MTNWRNPSDIPLGDITLAEAIELHLLWVNKEAEGKRLEVYDTNLTNANLNWAKFDGATMTGATNPDDTKHE